MKQKVLIALLLALSPALFAGTVLETGHTDLALGFDETSKAWDLHVGSDDTGLDYPANGVTLRVKSGAITGIPPSANYRFLGPAGRPIWILPQTQNEELLYLGYGGDDIPAGVFVGDQVTVTLKSVTGPGDFFSYKTDTFGNPVVYFNTADGISSTDKVTVQSGGDAHLNWAFTAPGVYKVTLQASATLQTGGTVTTSDPVTFTFQVAPPTILATGHTDLALGYDSDASAWDFHVGSDTFEQDFAANSALLEVKSAALTPVPSDSKFSFLGVAGTPIWILPQTQDEKLLYLGYGGDDIPEGVFVGNQVKVSLKSVTGPGDFFSYRTDTFGNPVVLFSTRDGITAADQTTVQSGGDAHLNWAFTAPGIYTVTLEASATLIAGNQPTSSGPVTSFFEVISPTVLDTGHTDLALDYDANAAAWNFHVGSDSRGLEYDANEVILQANGNAKTIVPPSAAFNFLGPTGAPVWILPQTQDESLLYLGYGGDGIPDGIFVGNQVKVSLKSVDGPGAFFSYKTDTFGNPVVYFNTADGIDDHDTINVQSGGDAHLNWAFTASGTYKVVLQASGTLVADGTITSSPAVTFTFNVVEPPPHLDSQHSDLRIQYSSAGTNVLSIVASDEDVQPRAKYADDQVLLIVKEEAKLTLPAGTPFGNEGDTLWVIPQSQNPDLLYLGISAEDVPTGVFNGGLTFRLVTFDGPGQFFLWQSDSSGNLNIKADTRDGLSSADGTTPIIPSHEHYNWAFTTNGIYHLTFQAAGMRIGDATNVTSVPTTFTFHVEPLPPPPEPPAHDQWRKNNWPTDTSLFITSDDSDPDFDKVPNFLEYAQGTNPNEADTAERPSFSFVSAGGKTYGALSFSKSVAATDVSYSVEAASNVEGPWAPITTIVTTVPNDDGSAERITVRDSVDVSSTGTRFYRVNFTLFH